MPDLPGFVQIEPVGQCNTLHVSLDGASARTYPAIRVRSRFERVLRNLRRVQRAKLAMGSALPRLHLVAVAMGWRRKGRTMCAAAARSMPERSEPEHPSTRHRRRAWHRTARKMHPSRQSRPS